LKSGIDRWIFPVIMAVPEMDRQLKLREKVQALSRHARRALHICAQKSGVAPGELRKDDNGAPLPFDGNFWSLTHKPAYVGAVISPEATGIDIEVIRDVSDGLIRKTAQEREWCLAESDPSSLFFRYWTAKEAVLKAAGVGISGLSRCRVIEVRGDSHLCLTYESEIFLVEHFFFDRHVASVVKSRFKVGWSLAV